jgi:hypothetical protein
MVSIYNSKYACTVATLKESYFKTTFLFSETLINNGACRCHCLEQGFELFDVANIQYFLFSQNYNMA